MKRRDWLRLLRRHDSQVRVLRATAADTSFADAIARQTSVADSLSETLRHLNEQVRLLGAAAKNMSNAVRRGAEDGTHRGRR